LAYAVANQSRFIPTAFGNGDSDSAVRISRKLPDFQPIQTALDDRISRLSPDLCRRLGVNSFVVSANELELVVHEDGARYAPHLDTFSSQQKSQRQRMVSAVYYFHSEPKSFSGGNLRLYAIGAPPENGRFLEVEPRRNTLVAFPPWVMHEVRTVAVPSGRFEDSRFAVNIWLRRAPSSLTPNTSE
jgi:Rps23 Pro-64 3,4-dihydroxylase Tpa1-like proline 4-hydroxylase